MPHATCHIWDLFKPDCKKQAEENARWSWRWSRDTRALVYKLCKYCNATNSYRYHCSEKCIEWVTSGIAANLAKTNLVYINCVCFYNFLQSTYFRIAIKIKSKIFFSWMQLHFLYEINSLLQLNGSLAHRSLVGNSSFQRDHEKCYKPNREAEMGLRFATPTARLPRLTSHL